VDGEMVICDRFWDLFYGLLGTLKQPITKTQLLEDKIHQWGHPPDVDDFVDFPFHMLKLDPAELLVHKWLHFNYLYEY
jgi:hypothetical protein